MKRDLAALQTEDYDLLVIGGGIYGVSIAWDATLRGLSVALVEKEDFGHATSANSLKTVHGGLRYLQNLDVKRMRESIRERMNLMRIAPHLVHPLPCLIPTYGHFIKGREIMFIALLLNDLISFDRNRLRDPQKHLPPGRILSKDECLAQLPGINPKGLNGGAVWYDGQMYNSERLTLAFALSAAGKGAAVANYVEVIGFLKENGRVVGGKAQDRITGDQFEIRARTVVNAAGPWVDRVLGATNNQGIALGYRLAKAINVGTRQIIKLYAVGLSETDAVKRAAVAHKAGRYFFVAPWRDKSIIGTTYIPYEGDLDNVQVTEQDIQELLDGMNRVYPSADLRVEDVSFVHCGLVPISGVSGKTGEAKRAKHYSIRNHGHEGLPGLISVLGVKYTTARDVAEKVVNLVYRSWGQEFPPSSSAYAPLYGGDIDRFGSYQETEINKKPCGLDQEIVRELTFNYGTAYPKVLSYLNQQGVSFFEDETPETAILKAQVIYAIRHEMALKLSDVIFRRTGLGAIGDPGEKTLALCADVMKAELSWDSERVQREIREVKESFPINRS
jgi:glycerol-3-phosphate dehydrogenase